MVEKKLFSINEIFYNIKNNNQAVLVNEKGYLLYEGETESMHSIATKMLNKKNRVNGFNHLYVKRNDKFILIDDIRKEYRNTKNKV